MKRRSFLAGLVLAPIGASELAKPEPDAVKITLHGDTDSRDAVYDLLEQINGAVRDGHKLT